MAVPDALANGFERLVAASRVPSRVRPQLVGFEGRFLNAQTDGLTRIWVASAAWDGSLGLTFDETMAVLAHELAHLEAQDPLRAACEAVALVGRRDGRVLAAMSQVVEYAEMFPELAGRVKELSQAQELRADRRAQHLLELAGYSPDAVASMLLKLQQRQPGREQASHPGLPSRVRALSKN